MNDLIRCIDTKTGKEKFLPPKVVADKKLMDSYNLIVQDNKVNKEAVKEITDPKEVVSELTENSDFEEVTETLEKPKKGRPKLTQ